MTATTDQKAMMRSDDLRRQRLEARLKEAKRPCFEPILETGDGSPGDSKMGGTPLGDPPTCKGCKKTMVLLLQLDPAALVSELGATANTIRSFLRTAERKAS